MEQSHARYGEEGFEKALKGLDADTQEVARLAAQLCAIKSVSVPPQKADFEAIRKSFDTVREYAEAHGLQIQEMKPDTENPYPFMLITFDEHDLNHPTFEEAIALMGHLDVVPAAEEQFQPTTDGKNLYARGAADMKTIVATYLVWMAKMQAERQKTVNTSTSPSNSITKNPAQTIKSSSAEFPSIQPPFIKSSSIDPPSAGLPPFILMLSGCEENGSSGDHNTKTAIEMLAQKGIRIRFAVVGERTGELEWMKNLQVGPICRENRSWRWAQASSETQATSETMKRPNINGINGINALKTVAGIIKTGRERIKTLNKTINPERTQNQPGLQSGFVNPFVYIGQDRKDTISSGATWIRAERKGGTSVHAATALPSESSLIENFHEIVENATQTFGADTIFIGHINIGEEGNFNTYDGSGIMTMAIDADPDEVQKWMETINDSGITLTTLDRTAIPNDDHDAHDRKPSIFGIDIRELPEHKTEIESLIEQIREKLSQGGVSELFAADPLHLQSKKSFSALPENWNFQMVNDRPSWQCPTDHEDLRRLEQAYMEVIGTNSLHYVKLHGNDGGLLAALQQSRDPIYKKEGLGDVVVFGQVGKFPHGKGEFHDLSSVNPYMEILDAWAEQYKK